MNSSKSESERELSRLEEKLEALLLYCQRLQHENETLNTLLQEWVAQRAEWSEQTSIAKNRVEAMIGRLKSMGPKT
jgi:cell division protein ZapB